MKHVVVLLILVVSVTWLATRKTKLERLTLPVASYAVERAGDRFVEIPAERLPTTPKALAEPGLLTIVYFRDETCHGCQMLDRDLADFSKVRPDVAIRKIRMTLNGDGYNEAIKNYRWKVYAAPCILIFGKDGALIAADDGLDFAGQDLLEAWMEAELGRAAGQPGYGARRAGGNQ